ncbi:MAG: 2,4-diaminopentanoate dehydrogenase [Gammaproteobacteria bacterium]|nr:2,4-diaminopentanoate dehydrogenase [Gammaproteobacteria bacterium]
MRDVVRVLVLGTGRMGSGVARLVCEKQGLELTGAFARRAERNGLDIGQAIGLDRDLGSSIATDLDAAIAYSQPDIAIQTTCSRIEDAMDEITTLVGAGVHVISIAEELAYPACRSAQAADELQRLAVANGVSILGTGINPGFVLDTLIVTLTGVCADVESISATRINDLSGYGPSVLKSQGVGLSEKAFRQGVDDGSVVGHIGFPESICLIAAALGWEIERIEETREAIVSRVRRQTALVTIEPGQTAGCLHKAVAYRQDNAVIMLEHPQQVRPDLEGVETSDTIEIKGTPDIRIVSSPELPGDVGTIAIAVNVIPHVLNASPGLHTMLDLPVSGALLGDAREFIAP